MRKVSGSPWAGAFFLFFVLSLSPLLADPPIPPKDSEALRAIQTDLANGDDFELVIPHTEEVGAETTNLTLPAPATATEVDAETERLWNQLKTQEDSTNLRSQTLVFVVKAEAEPPQKTRWLYERLLHEYRTGANTPEPVLIRVDPDKPEDQAARRKKYRTVKLVETTDSLLVNYSYEMKEKLRPHVKFQLLQAFAATSEFFGTSLRNVTRGIAYRLGVQKGVSFAMYSSEITGFRRNLRWQIQDVVFLGVVLGSLNATFTYLNNSGNPALNVAAASITAGAVQLFWSYLEPANNAFRTQGIKYDHRSKKATTSASWVYLTQFLFSLPSSLGVLAALYGGLDSDTFLHGLWNSAIGTFARKPIAEFIGRHQDSGSRHFHVDGSLRLTQKQARVANFVSGIFVSFLRIAHLAGADAGVIYTIMGFTGVGLEVFRHYTFKLELPHIEDFISSETNYKVRRFSHEVGKRIQKDWNSFLDRWNIRPLKKCETSLYLLKPGRFDQIRAEASLGVH